MPIEIQVGPPGITISRGRTFMVTDQRGEIDPQTEAGVYALDTRFVSSYRLFLNGEPLVLVYVNPTLPEWLSDLQVQHLRIGPCIFTLHFWREGDRLRWEVVERTADRGTAPQDLIETIDERESGSALSQDTGNITRPITLS